MNQFYANPRTDVRAHLEGRFARVLDVGCDTGLFASALVRDGIAECADGIELSAAAGDAERELARVFRVDLSSSAEGLPEGAYDLVLCLDVLEHMIDPWAALERIRRLLKPGGTLLVSLPNVRHLRVVLPLVLRGRWDYADTGLLDRTHLRFFTRATAREMLEGAGFRVEKEVSLSMRPGSKAWLLNLATLGLFRGILEHQYLFFAKNA